jgi:cobalt/nickel transport system ATP-binding protein
MISGMSPVILSARGLEYRYPGGIAALNGLDLEVRRGRKLALLGANGCGKTTLLLHLNGTLKPSRGQVLLNGAVAGYGRQALNAWRSQVGLVLQEPDDQLFSATVFQDVSFGPLNQGLPEATVRDRVAASLATLRISDLAERPTHALSFGQKKRVAMAGVLAMQPEVLILDEPTSGLDPRGVAHLLAALEQLRLAGTTLVFSTHDVDLAYAWADDVAILGQGRMLQQGEAVATLADPERLHAAHLKTPTLLALAIALGIADEPGYTGPPPRTQAALIARLQGSLELKTFPETNPPRTHHDHDSHQRNRTDGYPDTPSGTV